MDDSYSNAGYLEKKNQQCQMTEWTAQTEKQAMQRETVEKAEVMKKKVHTDNNIAM